ncbi:hypothetical protein [Namhaeicola litoreus]|uniref:DUF4919 domain-containing protein n=1 Tax=Namhaeicola litoreus TaxID=1052145 RepID=A0ABW3Y5W3_9FLAO
MKRKLLFFTLFVLMSISAISQMDYSEIKFKSNVYQYKDVMPRTEELGISKYLLAEIVETLGNSFYTKAEKEEIIEKAYLALTNPKLFDYVYKDFAVTSNNNWGSRNSQGEIILEPNPYLTDWTISDNEYPYFQLAFNKILDHFRLMSYGDDAESVASSFNELLITKDFKFSEPKEDDWAYSYLETINGELAEKGLVALVTKGYYQIVVCKIENKEKLTDLFEKFKWELVQP